MYTYDVFNITVIETDKKRKMEEHNLKILKTFDKNSNDND